MCLAQGPQCSDAGEAWTHGTSVSSQALYHWAIAIPLYVFYDFMKNTALLIVLISSVLLPLWWYRYPYLYAYVAYPGHLYYDYYSKTTTTTTAITTATTILRLFQQQQLFYC